ncbi:MAG: 2-hydroxyacyl-CoA dehydratase [Ruminiclostridium sp.]|nr:2-hydroxyacyl-CoA dehydratase [Ruminiclostridium sp.]
MEAVFQKEKHTLLMPDLFPVHMELLADAIRASGYRVQVLRNQGADVLEQGLKYIHNDMCYPAICSLGQQLHAVTSGSHDPNAVALIQFQTGGGCRASNYGMVLKKALERLGKSQIPVVTLGFTTLSRDSGFRLTPLMCLRALAAITFGDLMMLLKNQVRPYEVQPGAAQAVLERWQDHLKGLLYSASVLPFQLKRHLEQLAQDFAAIPTRVSQKVKVGIVGEVYAQYSPFANNNLEEFLESQDCEYMLPGVLGFLHYCLTGPAVDRVLYGGGRTKAALSRGLTAVIAAYERVLDQVLQTFPQFVRPSPFRQMRALGEQVLGRGVKMGEGWYLAAEMGDLVRHGYDNILCAQPFGCLPNHIVGRGTFRRFRELYPHANLCPIDYDANASRVNQENRIKLMLAVARQRAGLAQH